MSAQTLLNDLARAGVVLYLDGEKLKFRAEPGTYTDERRALVSANREALIEALKAPPLGGPPPGGETSGLQKTSGSGGWPEAIAPLVEWALSLTPSELPPVPFNLRPGVAVQGAEQWLARLQRDLSIGPTEPRARTGAMQRDLENLADLLRLHPKKGDEGGGGTELSGEKQKEAGPMPIAS